MNTIRSGVVGLVFLAAGLLAQTPAEALARVRLIEENEGNLAQAEQGYRDLLGKADLPAAVGGEAALRLGRLLWSLDRQEEARPFLQRAIASGVAEVTLAAQTVLDGKFDPKQEAALRERAARLLERIAILLNEPMPAEGRSANWGHAWTTTEKGLIALGEAAAAACVDTLTHLANQWQRDDGMPRVAPDTLLSHTEFERTVAGLLWQLGTPSAVRFFEMVANHPSPTFRRLMVRPCAAAAPSMVPIALRFLADPDPDGVVPTSVQPLLERAPWLTVASLIESPTASVSACALAALANRLDEVIPARRATALAAIVESAKRLGDPGDPTLARSARTLVLAAHLAGGPDNLRFVFEHLPSWPSDRFLQQLQPNAIRDQDLALLRTAAQAIGRFVNGDHRCAVIVRYLQANDVDITNQGCDAVLALLGEGYGGGSAGTVMRKFADVATDVQMAALVRLAPHLPRDNYLSYITRRRHAPSIVPAVREAFAQVAGRRSNAHEELINIAGFSGSEEAAAWLAGLSVSPGLIPHVVDALVQLSVDGVGEAALRPLRTLVATEALQADRRNLIIAELTRRGDPGAIEILGAAVRLSLGMQIVHPLGRGLHHPVGAAWLCQLRAPNGQDMVTWAAYGPADLEQAWRVILQPTENAEFVGNQINQHTIPRAAIIPFLEWLPRVLKQPTLVSDRNRWYWPIARCIADLTTEDLARDPPLEQGLVQHLAVPSIAQELIRMLPPTLCHHFEAQIRSVLWQLPEPVLVVGNLASAGITLTNDEWLLVLRRDSGHADALAALPDRIEPPVLRHVESMLQDPDAQTRIAAATALARFLSPDSVAPLLATLRDANPDVRKAATEALERIRFYQDQTAHWSKVQRGIDVTKAAAASSLVEQAGHSAPKEQRLLAIRSLGVLGAPEVLPYLIRWTQDQDTDIAQAARDACARLHRTGDAPAADARTDK